MSITKIKFLLTILLLLFSGCANRLCEPSVTCDLGYENSSDANLGPWDGECPWGPHLRWDVIGSHRDPYQAWCGMVDLHIPVPQAEVRVPSLGDECLFTDIHVPIIEMVSGNCVWRQEAYGCVSDWVFSSCRPPIGIQ